MSEAQVKLDPKIERKVKQLLKVGKKKGFITYEDIDKAFPPEFDGFNSELIEKIYEELEKNDIKIIERDPSEGIEEVDDIEELLKEGGPEMYDNTSLKDPIKMYLSDIFTIAVNLAGLPAISIPCGFDGKGLPIGVQLIGKAFDEGTILKVADVLEKELKINNLPNAQ
jgi:Asp-tRNA(Asn)/Glu-tRNA(Gln) amidotransferase A subunit family amidase